jgi:hypothetical protein
MADQVALVSSTTTCKAYRVAVRHLLRFLFKQRSNAFAILPHV